jgi:addiction module HigA family antidote
MKKIGLTTPGEILLEELMKPLGLTHYRVAKDCRIPHPTMNGIIENGGSISIENAMRLAIGARNFKSTTRRSRLLDLEAGAQQVRQRLFADRGHQSSACLLPERATDKGVQVLPCG